MLKLLENHDKMCLGNVAQEFLGGVSQLFELRQLLAKFENFDQKCQNSDFFVKISYFFKHFLVKIFKPTASGLNKTHGRENPSGILLSYHDLASNFSIFELKLCFVRLSIRIIFTKQQCVFFAIFSKHRHCLVKFDIKNGFSDSFPFQKSGITFKLYFVVYILKVIRRSLFFFFWVRNFMGWHLTLPEMISLKDHGHCNISLCIC